MAHHLTNKKFFFKCFIYIPKGFFSFFYILKQVVQPNPYS